MAKKEEAPNMVERFAEFKELKNIDKTTMAGIFGICPLCDLFPNSRLRV